MLRNQGQHTGMRSYKIVEFAAHDGAVNCIRIGRGTAGVLATGGEDKKVNLWRTGQTQVVKSLSGLQSPVESVVFDEREETIAAGGANGTIKIWDMECGKVSRSLTGHRSNCLSLAFTTSDSHCLISGSLDCNAKVWDLRRKEALFTLRGHSSGVVKVAPSPDNKWVATGAADGDVKVWDLGTGKAFPECSTWRHSARITGLDFSPKERVLITCGADRMVRVWDLAAWAETDSLGPEATALQGLEISDDGRVLLGATADALKVYGLDPVGPLDTVPMNWRNLADLRIFDRDGPRALGCCRSGSSVGVFMVDLRMVLPYCWREGGAEGEGIGTGGLQQQLQLGGVGSSSSSSSRRAAAVMQQDLSAGGLQLVPAQQQQQQQLPRRLSDRDTGARQAAAALLGDAAFAPSSPEVRQGPLTTQLARHRTPKREAAVVTAFTGSAAGGISSSSSAPGSGALTSLRALTASGSASGRSRPRQSPFDAAQQQQQQGQGSGYFPDVEILVPAGPPPPAAPIAQQQPARQPQAPAEQQWQFASATNNTAAVGSGGSLQYSSSSGYNNSSRPFPGLDLNAAPAAAAASQQPDLAAGLGALSLLDTQEQQQQQQQARGMSRSDSSSKQQEAPGALVATLRSWMQEQAPQPTRKAASEAVSTSSSRSSSIPASRVPSRQNMGPLLQPQPLQQQPQQQQQAPVASSSVAPAAAAAAAAPDPLLAAFAKAPTLRADLARLLSGLQVAKGFVARGNMQNAYKSVLSSKDPALACMVLEAVSSRADAFELNSLEPLIKLLELLLGSDKEPQVATGLSVLGLVLRGPGQVVHDVCSAPQPTGVDLSFERRRSRCMLLKMALEGLGLKVGVLARSPGQLQRQAQMLAEDLKRLGAAGL